MNSEPGSSSLPPYFEYQRGYTTKTSTFQLTFVRRYIWMCVNCDLPVHFETTNQTEAFRFEAEAGPSLSSRGLSDLLWRLRSGQSAIRQHLGRETWEQPGDPLGQRKSTKLRIFLGETMFMDMKQNSGCFSLLDLKGLFWSEECWLIGGLHVSRPPKCLKNHLTRAPNRG